MPGGNEILDDDENQSRSRNVFLGNSDSEFTIVVGDRSKVSSDFGLHCISTIDELNDRIANLDNLGKASHFGHDLSSDESDDEKKESDRDVEVVKTEHNHAKQIVQSNVKKPLLVELHSFPGFDSNNLTPLPSNLEALYILKVITEAKRDLLNKATYKKIFTQFFDSANSQGILQDAFWWYFCHKYQPAAGPQEKLFDRIAKNYTSLLVTWTGSKYQDKLFKDYADLMSQAVYSTFCHAFPTSYRQFNAEFRDDILCLINLWMMGTKPAPRTWEKWNFDGIEPNGLRKGGIVKEEVEKADTLESNLERIESPPNSATRRVTLDSSITAKRSSAVLKKSSVMLKRSSVMLKSPTKDGSHPSILKNGKKKDSVANMMQQISSVLGLAEKSEKKNSCAAEGGPTFERVVFNLHGRSPLVEHFLNSHQLSRDAGTSVLVQRTEIASLPPLSAETYQDVIHNVKENSKQLQQKHQDMMSAQQKEFQDMLHKHKTDNQHFTKCSEKLLSNPQEVRKLSELLRATYGKEEQEDVENRSAKLRSLVIHALEGGSENV